MNDLSKTKHITKLNRNIRYYIQLTCHNIIYTEVCLIKQLSLPSYETVRRLAEKRKNNCSVKARLLGRKKVLQLTLLGHNYK